MSYGDYTYKKFRGESSAASEDFMPLLLYQYQKESPNLQSLIRVHWDRMGRLVDIAAQLQRYRQIDVAYGKTQDSIGAIVGAARNGQEDIAFRKWIKFNILLNQFSGTGEELITAAALLTSGTKIELYEDNFANVWIYTNGYDVSRDTLELLDSIAAGGVKVQGLIHVEPNGEDFCVEIEEPDIASDNELGFGELNEEFDENGAPLGGQFVELYTWED